MILPRTRALYAAVKPVNLRCSFDVLLGIARDQLGLDVVRSSIVIFFNRTRDRCKLVFHDGTGMVIWYKRIDRGRFQVPSAVLPNDLSVVIDVRELALILDGRPQK